jgi:hypothetical protein
VGASRAREGFTLEHNGYQQSNKEMAAVRDFTPPCCSVVTYNYPLGATAEFVIYFVPVAPGVTRTYFNVKMPSFNGRGAQKGVREGGSFGMLKALHPQVIIIIIIITNLLMPVYSDSFTHLGVLSGTH